MPRVMNVTTYQVAGVKQGHGIKWERAPPMFLTASPLHVLPVSQTGFEHGYSFLLKYRSKLGFKINLADM